MGIHRRVDFRSCSSPTELVDAADIIVRFGIHTWIRSGSWFALKARSSIGVSPTGVRTFPIILRYALN